MEINKEPKRKRLIELPERLWAIIDDDARRSRRTSMKQLQAILEAYYELGNLELHDPAPARAITSVYGKTIDAGQKGLLMSDPTAGKGKQKLDERDVRRDARDRTSKKKSGV